MVTRRFAPWLALLLLWISSSASAFFDPPYITPTNPIAGQTISVNIYGGVCDAILGIPGYPQITQDGSSIRILFFGVRNTDPELCLPGAGTATSPIGSYPAGAYTLQVDLRYFGAAGEVEIDTLGTVPFTVVAAPSTLAPIPALNGLGLCLLALTLVVCARSAARRRSASLLLMLGFGLSLQVRAQSEPLPNHTIEVLVTSAAGAPSAQQLVDAYARSPAKPPPLQAFAAVPPSAVAYLLPMRADGDFLARLQAAPDSVRAKLERYVLVTYPDDTSLDRALDALHADPYVQSAQEPVPMDFSSVELIDFGIGSDIEPERTQYGRDDLNIDAAWQLAGGYALVADIDSGLYVTTPLCDSFRTPANISAAISCRSIRLMSA